MHIAEHQKNDELTVKLVVAGRVRQVLRNLNQSVVKSKLSSCGASLHVVVQMLVDSQALGSSPDSAATAAAKALTEGELL